MDDNVVTYICPYCGTINQVDVEALDEYAECSNCEGLVDVEIDDYGNVVVEEF